ncbi:MAG: hypothetical protein GWO41_14630, partial [candidate division Zixibacteria bacterium]|nr:hypothetical protein [candidate division Zixibacteria bacterium]NIW44401.1 hypothetical protein [Gammaproteobacteria bacterium]NIX55865.1 hypothetical protein [candidate division Zixibacteria bacterium]
RKAHTPDALQGVETEVKRTATEIAKMTSSGINILQTLATIIWAQTLKPMAEMCVQNNQQLLSEQRYYRILGNYAKELITPAQEFPGGPAVLAGPEDIQGNFDFPIRDVNLPLKPSDNAEIWAEVFQTASSNPLLAQRIDIFWIFKQLAESLGIKNIEDADLAQQMGQSTLNYQVLPDEQIANQEQAGNIIPMPMR